MTGKASKESLSDLHGVFAEVCIDKLRELEPINQMTVEGPVTVGYRRAIKSGDMNAIRAFLNDNSVTVDIGTNAGMRTLESQLAGEKRLSDKVVALPLPSGAAHESTG